MARPGTAIWNTICNAEQIKLPCSCNAQAKATFRGQSGWALKESPCPAEDPHGHIVPWTPDSSGTQWWQGVPWQPQSRSQIPQPPSVSTNPIKLVFRDVTLWLFLNNLPFFTAFTYEMDHGQRERTPEQHLMG